MYQAKRAHNNNNRHYHHHSYHQDLGRTQGYANVVLVTRTNQPRKRNKTESQLQSNNTVDWQYLIGTKLLDINEIINILQ